MDHLLANPEPPSSSALPGIPMGPTGELKDMGMIRECLWVLSIEVGAPVARERQTTIYSRRTHCKVCPHPLFPRSTHVVVNEKPVLIRFAKEPSVGCIYFEERTQNTNEGDGVECGMS